MSLISAEEIEVSGDENLGIGGGEVTQERNLEAEGLKQGEKMAGNHLDVTVGDDLPVLDAAVQQSLEENGKLCGALHYDLGEIHMLPLALKHHVHEGLKFTLIDDGLINDVIAYMDEAVDGIAEGSIPGHGAVVGEHLSGDELYRIVIDLVLVPEILIERGA